MIGQEVYNYILNGIEPSERLDIELSNPMEVDHLEYVYILKLYQVPNDYPGSHPLYSKEWYFLLDSNGEIIRGGEVFVVDGKSKVNYSLGIEMVRGIQLNKLGI